MADLLGAMARLDVLEQREEKARKELAEINKWTKLPFWQRIQKEPFKLQLEQCYETQKWTFEKILKKDNNRRLPKDWEDEFALFWVGFLKGEYKSINHYLKRKNVKAS